jgi:uncharacterized protein (TIGR03083 family)
MRLTPRYGDPDLLRVVAPELDPCVPMVRQRRRFAERLATLDAGQWATPSRCAGWSVQDVVTHLIGTNQFWAMSVTAGLAGTPTAFLTDFDTDATPAQLVGAARPRSGEETLKRFVRTNEAIFDAIAGIDETGLSALAETPPGHLPIRALLLHALWDSWVHERDVLVPLGLVPDEEPDEVAASLLYAAALGPVIMAAGGSTRTGVLGIEASDPDVVFHVEIGPNVVVRTGPAPGGVPKLTGGAVPLVEAIGGRAPFVHPLGGDDHWMLGGMTGVFEPAT